MPIEYDAVVVGAGPNGLAAAITLARAGCSVLVCEVNATIGGGARSADLTLPGFLHDICSAVHPLAAGSPFFKTMPLERFGLIWIQPEIPLAHPFDDGSAACLYRDVDLTAEQFTGDSQKFPDGQIQKNGARFWQIIQIINAMVYLDFPAEFTKIIGERICDLLRAASWNRPAYSVPGKPEHKCEGRGNRRFQRKKRVSSNPREKSPGWFVLK